MSDDPDSAIRVPKAADMVADAIRRMITTGELAEGDLLQPEAQIIAEFAVSRPTIREAFRVLESERLISVTRGARGGARVHAPRADQVARYAGFVLQSKRATYADVFAARRLIEPPAARLVAEKRRRDAPAPLRAAIAAAREAVGTVRAGACVAAFHDELIRLTGNQTLILMFGMIEGIVAGFQSTKLAQADAAPVARRGYFAGLKSQEKLVALIESGDGAGAEAHWRAHMEVSTRVWLNSDLAQAIVDWRG